MTYTVKCLKHRVWDTIVVFAIFAFVPPAMARQDKLDARIKNESSLTYLSNDSPARGDDVVGATFCRGTVPGAKEELAKIGISENDLTKEVYCTIGDFDGNGYLDFAIWGGQREQNKWPDYQNYVVVFFEKDRVIRSIAIKSEHSGRLLVHYPPRHQVGQNGEPVSAHDALFEIGETDGRDDISKGTVFVFDAETAAFKKLRFSGK